MTIPKYRAEGKYVDLDVLGTIEKDKDEKFDLILCGKEFTDGITGQVVVMLAEKSGIDFVSNAIEIDL